MRRGHGAEPEETSGSLLGWLCERVGIIEHLSGLKFGDFAE